MTEYDNRTRWTGVPNILLRHINNDMTLTNEAGEVLPQRQNIKDLVKARVKKEHNNPRPWDDIIKKRIPDMDAPTGI